MSRGRFGTPFGKLKVSDDPSQGSEPRRTRIIVPAPANQSLNLTGAAAAASIPFPWRRGGDLAWGEDGIPGVGAGRQTAEVIQIDVVVADAAKAREQLERFGPVDVRPLSES